jgi:hypothetical protein
MPLTIDYESDWLGRLRKKMYEQFKGKTKFDLWVQTIARQFQDLEDAFQGLLTIINIDDSVGAQLDNLGRIVGQQRTGLDDTTYRLYLRARIIANKSNGTTEDLYRVFRALLGALGYKYSFGGTKSFVLRVLSSITPQQVIAATDFLHDSKEAGARAVLQWQGVPGEESGHSNSQLFTFSIGPGFNVGVFAGATQV